ncbi:hypothetical protein PENTCL1PPCAC_12649, partial [Pristionchus entomophagus]
NGMVRCYWRPILPNQDVSIDCLMSLWICVRRPLAMKNVAGNSGKLLSHIVSSSSVLKLICSIDASERLDALCKVFMIQTAEDEKTRYSSNNHMYTLISVGVLLDISDRIESIEIATTNSSRNIDREKFVELVLMMFEKRVNSIIIMDGCIFTGEDVGLITETLLSRSQPFHFRILFQKEPFNVKHSTCAG